MSSATDIASLVDSLGVTLTLDEDDLVTTVVMVSQVIKADGTVELAISDSDGTSFITRLGMLTAATQIELHAFGRSDDDE